MLCGVVLCYVSIPTVPQPTGWVDYVMTKGKEQKQPTGRGISHARTAARLPACPPPGPVANLPETRERRRTSRGVKSVGCHGSAVQDSCWPCSLTIVLSNWPRRTAEGEDRSGESPGLSTQLLCAARAEVQFPTTTKQPYSLDPALSPQDRSEVATEDEETTQSPRRSSEHQARTQRRSSDGRVRLSHVA